MIKRNEENYLIFRVQENDKFAKNKWIVHHYTIINFASVLYILIPIFF